MDRPSDQHGARSRIARIHKGLFTLGASGDLGAHGALEVSREDTAFGIGPHHIQGLVPE